MRKPFENGFKVKYDFFVRTINYECTNYFAFEGDCSDFKDIERGCNVFRSISDLFKNSDKYLINGTLIIGGKVRLRLIKDQTLLFILFFLYSIQD